jgi:hypothetical protein
MVCGKGKICIKKIITGIAHYKMVCGKVKI